MLNAVKKHLIDHLAGEAVSYVTHGIIGIILLLFALHKVNGMMDGVQESVTEIRQTVVQHISAQTEQLDKIVAHFEVTAGSASQIVTGEMEKLKNDNRTLIDAIGAKLKKEKHE